MILEKIYKVRVDSPKDRDELIETLAEDIRNGYTAQTVDYWGKCEPDASAINCEITMVKKWVIGK